MKIIKEHWNNSSIGEFTGRKRIYLYDKQFNLQCFGTDKKLTNWHYKIL